MEGAIETYRSALKCLPRCPKEKDTKPASTDKAAPPPIAESGIQEITDEQAAALEEEQRKASEHKVTAEEKEKQDVEEEIRQCQRACWSNIAAAYMALVSSPPRYSYF